MTKRIRVSVPVTVHGEAKGIKLQGGLLEIITRSVEIEVHSGRNSGAASSVDVTELMIGNSVRAGEIQMPGSAKLVGNPDTVIAHVVGQRAEEAAPAADATAAAEPEVAAKKGKKEDEAPARGRKGQEEVAGVPGRGSRQPGGGICGYAA